MDGQTMYTASLEAYAEKMRQGLDQLVEDTINGAMKNPGLNAEMCDNISDICNGQDSDQIIVALTIVLATVIRDMYNMDLMSRVAYATSVLTTIFPQMDAVLDEFDAQREKEKESDESHADPTEHVPFMTPKGVA